MNETTEKYFLYIILIAAILLAPALPVWFQAAPDEVQTMAEGDSNFTNVVASGDITAGDDLSVGDDATVTGDLTVSGSTSMGAQTLTGLTVNGNATITGTLDQQGNVSDSGGVFTVADNALIDGAADAVQLTVQGYTTNTNYLFVVEQSDGTDVWRTNNVGQSSSANGAVSFIDDVIVDGQADTDQLTVQGYTTQTNELQVWEQSDGTDVALMSNAGALDLDSTLVFGADNLYPLGYASANIQIECGTATFTETTTVTASALTTVTYALVTQATDPASTASIITIDAPSTNTFVVSSWESDFTVGTTPIAFYWCAVGNQ